MTFELYVYIFSYLNVYDMLMTARVNKIFRQVIIYKNEKWHSICFNEIYNFALYYFYKKTEINCVHCLLCRVINFEEIIDNNVEKYNEMCYSYYNLFMIIMNKLSWSYGREMECICDEKFEISKICMVPKCICFEKYTSLLLEWFPKINENSNYNIKSLIRYTTLCCNYIYEKKGIIYGENILENKYKPEKTRLKEIMQISITSTSMCEMCYFHFDEKEILWIDECILYKCHLMMSDRDCYCGLMEICKKCRSELK